MDRKLLKMTLTSGSSKVFNCLSMTRELSGIEHAHLPEHARSFGGKPSDHLFSVKALNKGIFFKEPRDKNFGTSSDRPAVDTMIYFPYNEEKLTEGGATVSLHDHRFEAVIRDFTESFGTYEHRNPATDKLILKVLKETPSLDPYLLKSAFQRENVEVPPSYLKISEEEWNSIRAFVQAKLHPMITFGMSATGAMSKSKADDFIERIWDGSDVSSLYPLFGALKIPMCDAQNIIFTWKGLTFFDYIYQSKTMSIRNCATWLANFAKPSDVKRSAAMTRIESRRNEIRRSLRINLQTVIGILEGYNRAYNSLFVLKQGAVEFQSAMLSCPSSYLTLGTSLNRIDHCSEIVSRTLKGDYARTLLHDELDELFQCLADVLR